MKRRISAYLVAIAMLFTMAHSAIPHHHHHNLICFNPNCVSACCDDMHDHCDGTTHCACPHHHHHPEENCSLFLPFILSDNTMQISPSCDDNSFDFQSFAIIVNALAQLSGLKMNGLLDWPDADIPLCSAFGRLACGLRAPPALI